MRIKIFNVHIEDLEPYLTPNKHCFMLFRLSWLFRVAINKTFLFLFKRSLLNESDSQGPETGLEAFCSRATQWLTKTSAV